MSSAGSLSKLLDDKNIDIAFISEHKLREQQVSFLNSIHSNFSAHTICDTSVGPNARCGKGGVAILYKKSCQFTISKLDVQINDRIIGVQIDGKHLKPIYAFSVYLPSVNYSYNDYAECIDYLRVLYETFSESGSVLFLGDFNCDVSKPEAGDKRYLKLQTFIENTNVCPISIGGQYTFRPTCKVLDYVMIHRDNVELIATNSVINNDICVVSDHLPIHTIMKFELIQYSSDGHPLVAWNKCNNEQLMLYRSTLEHELQNISLPEPCRPADVNKYYEDIVNAIHKAANLALPRSKFNKHAKPYWTREVRAAHTQQRLKRKQWIEHGRPRNQDNPFYRSYKDSKRRFRTLQKAAIANVELKYYQDLNSSAECDMRQFWHLVNQRRKIKSSTVCKLKSGDAILNTPEDISESFATYFSNIFIPTETNNFDSDFKQLIESRVNSFDNEQSYGCENLSCPVELSELENLIKDLKRRKSPGPDEVTNEHIVYGGPVLLISLKSLFDQMFALEYVPDKFKIGIIIPVHKPGKCRDATESYRPITLVSTLYKLFENVLHARLKHWSSLSNKCFPSMQQNAYQKYLGSITASFNLQETIAHNVELGSTCYTAFLDAAKAFDNVWHDGLFFKLFEFGIRGKPLNLIMTSYSDMSSYIYINGVKSAIFPIKQGVRQGCVTSTWYFLLYIDGLLKELEDSGTGCTIGSLKPEILL